MIPNIDALAEMHYSSLDPAFRLIDDDLEAQKEREQARRNNNNRNNDRRKRNDRKPKEFDASQIRNSSFRIKQK